MSHKVIVLGANGQLGKTFLDKKANDENWTFLSKQDLDITNQIPISTLFDNHKPTVLINCAAYTAVDSAEENQELAEVINSKAISYLAKECKKANCLMIHYSSDYVYHSIASRPLLETDPTLPKGIYAQSKLNGEQALVNSGSDYFIIRTSWVYSCFNNNFVKTMLKLFDLKDSLNIVNDQIGAPSYTYDIVNVTLNLINKWKAKKLRPKQIFNFANDGQISWYEFAVAIKEISKAKVNLNPIPSSEYPTPAERPKWSVLDLTKIKDALNLKQLPWRDSLVDCIERLNNKTS